MTRFTQYHDWPVPESADSDYHETLDRFINNVDVEVLLKGTLANRPVAGIQNRWYLTTDEDPPTIYYDTGDAWVSPATYGDPPEELARRNREETIGPQWTFDEVIDADITGDATEADHAAHAEQADNARRLAGHSEEEFARTGRDETFEGKVAFERNVQMTGVRVQDGTIQLPQYSGSDPTNEPGDMWLRLDRQP